MTGRPQIFSLIEERHVEQTQDLISKDKTMRRLDAKAHGENGNDEAYGNVTPAHMNIVEEEETKVSAEKAVFIAGLVST